MYRLKIASDANSEPVETINPQRWNQIIIASLLFIAGNLVDYMLTVYGISNRLYEEANPIIQGYIKYFGLRSGLLLFKALMCISIIFGVIIFDKICRQRGIKFRSEFLLYIGAFTTIVAGLLWLTGL